MIRAKIHLTDNQMAKLRHISNETDRSIDDLAGCAIDEAIINWERENGKVKL